MKINAKVLSIPPYISTSWDNVFSLQTDPISNQLIIQLKSGMRVAIPDLSKEVTLQIFTAHAEFIDGVNRLQNIKENIGSILNIGMNPLQIGTEGFDQITGIMQHDPSQKDAPEIPKEILDKIAELIKGFGLDLKTFHLPEGEPHCSCPFCQVSKALHQTLEVSEGKESDIENEVADTDLHFREWDIKQVAEKLYTVTNPFDQKEQYQVFLGKPIGCTCGETNCKHIVAVLSS